MERLFYEFRPYLFIAVGLIAFMNAHSNSLLKISGLSLALLSAIIVWARYSARNRLA